MNVNEKTESAISYGVGLGGFAIAKMADLTLFAHDLAVILACVVVALRVVYDAVRTYRYLTRKE